MPRRTVHDHAKRPPRAYSQCAYKVIKVTDAHRQDRANPNPSTEAYCKLCAVRFEAGGAVAREQDVVE